MKTAFDILKSNGMIKEQNSGAIAIMHFSNYLGFINIMEEYAQEKLREEKLQNTLLAQKCSDLADELEIYKDIDLQAMVKEQQQTIEDQNAELKYLTSQLKAVTRETVDQEERFDQLDDEYQELVKFSTMIFRGIPRFELTALMSSDQFEKFKNHLGV